MPRTLRTRLASWNDAEPAAPVRVGVVEDRVWKVVGVDLVGVVGEAVAPQDELGPVGRDVIGIEVGEGGSTKCWL